MDLGLRDKRAIVTGGSSLGIGKAIARELAREGADVAIVARTKDKLETAAQELAAETKDRVIAISADVAVPSLLGAFRIRVWAIMSRGWKPGTGQPRPQGRSCWCQAGAKRVRSTACLRTCRHAEVSSVCPVGLLLILLSRLRVGIRNQ
jgi:hypothetical protein